jgi:hypothetical protein
MYVMAQQHIDWRSLIFRFSQGVAGAIGGVFTSLLDLQLKPAVGKFV